MEFSNQEIDVSTLPKAEDTKLIPIDNRYYTVMTYHQAVYWSLYFLACIILIIQTPEFHSWLMVGLTLLAFAIICSLYFRLIFLDFKNKAYAIREHDILYQTGWLKKSLHICPFNRIQHCSVDAGVFERNLGISKLKIYSAGSNDTDITIPGLTLAEANSIRELIILKNNPE